MSGTTNGLVIPPTDLSSFYVMVNGQQVTLGELAAQVMSQPTPAPGNNPSTSGAGGVC